MKLYKNLSKKLLTNKKMTFYREKKKFQHIKIQANNLIVNFHKNLQIVLMIR